MRVLDDGLSRHADIVRLLELSDAPHRRTLKLRSTFFIALNAVVEQIGVRFLVAAVVANVTESLPLFGQ